MQYFYAWSVDLVCIQDAHGQSDISEWLVVDYGTGAGKREIRVAVQKLKNTTRVRRQGKYVWLLRTKA